MPPSSVIYETHVLHVAGAVELAPEGAGAAAAERIERRDHSQCRNRTDAVRGRATVRDDPQQPPALAAVSVRPRRRGDEREPRTRVP